MQTTPHTRADGCVVQFSRSCPAARWTVCCRRPRRAGLTQQ